MSAPTFLSEDINVIQSDLLTAYLNNGGTTPAPASTEQLMLNTCAYSIYRNNLLVNDAIRQNFVRFARGGMLDYLGELTGVVRLESESDDAYRVRIPLSLKALSAGGTADYYKYHALASSADIIDATAVMTVAGTVQVTILSATDTTKADDLLLATATLTSDSVRSLCDTLMVQQASAIIYNVTANIAPVAGVLFSDAQAACIAAINALNATWRKLGQAIIPSQIIDACHGTGKVSRVELVTPAYTAVGKNAYPSLGAVTVGTL